MSTDKLADVIQGLNMPGGIVPGRAADRVRERFVVIDRLDAKTEMRKTGRDLYAVAHHRLGYVGSAVATVENPKAPNLDPDWHEATALAHLAMAEHLRKNPPVNEEAVRELAAFLDNEGLSVPNDGLARRMVKAGWKREVEATRTALRK